MSVNSAWSIIVLGIASTTQTHTRSLLAAATRRKMMHRHLMRSFLILITIVTSSCQFLQPNDERAMELALSWQANIDQISDLLSSQTIPEHLLVEKPILRGDEFDIMEVFDVVDHINMADGYKLAYVYRYDPMGSSPILYAQAADSPPYASLRDYREAQPECFQSGEKPPDCDYMQYVKSDGSELGFLQWILLSVMGRQFYLHWHANYNDATLVATEEAVDKIITRISEYCFPLDLKQKTVLNLVDPAPEVRIGADTVTVRAVWFTKFGGFVETQQTLNRTPPHTILEAGYRNLLDYECGIVY